MHAYFSKFQPWPGILFEEFLLFENRDIKMHGSMLKINIFFRKNRLTHSLVAWAAQWTHRAQFSQKWLKMAHMLLIKLDVDLLSSRITSNQHKYRLSWADFRKHSNKGFAKRVLCIKNFSLEENIKADWPYACGIRRFFSIAAPSNGKHVVYLILLN